MSQPVKTNPKAKIGLFRCLLAQGNSIWVFSQPPTLFHQILPSLVNTFMVLCVCASSWLLFQTLPTIYSSCGHCVWERALALSLSVPPHAPTCHLNGDGPLMEESLIASLHNSEPEFGRVLSGFTGGCHVDFIRALHSRVQ